MGTRSAGGRFAALQVSNFRLFFVGSVISIAGTWMQTTGQAWLVLKISDSPVALSTVVSLQSLPIMLFTLFGGAVADKFPRRPMLFVTQLAAMFQSALLGFLALTGHIQLWHLFILAPMLGLVNALDNPLRQAFVTELVDRETLPNAVALNATVQNLGRILGPAAGGAVIGFFGVETAFFLNSTSFLGIVAALLLINKATMQPRVRKSTGNVVKQVGEGLVFARRTPPIFFLVIACAFIGMFGFNFSTMIPLVTTDLLHASASEFGILNSCLGVGSFSTAIFLAAKGKPTTRRVVGAGIAFGAGLFLISFSRNFFVTGALFAIVGGASVTFTTAVSTSLQLIAPDNMRGRMAGLQQLLTAGASPIGQTLTGTVAELTSVSGALIWNGVMCCVGVGLALVYRWRSNAGAVSLEELMAERAAAEMAAAASTAMPAGIEANGSLAGR